MNRRTYVASVLLGGVSAAGCISAIGSNSDTKDPKMEDKISISSPDIPQGKTKSISIKIRNTSMLRVVLTQTKEKAQSEEDPSLELLFNESNISPGPDRVWNALPPTYEWERKQDVQANIPIKTYSDTPPGTYDIECSFSSEDSKSRKKETFTITVISDT